MTYKNRIKELRNVPFSEIRNNPKNWRKHPESQKSAMKGVLDSIGWADAVLVRETETGLELLDGHLRKQLAEDDIVPVLVLDVSDEEADLILATHDPLAAMAETDQALLDQLVGSIDFIENDNAKEMLDSIASDEIIESVEDQIPDAQKTSKTKTGDLFELGNHRLLCGDSTSSKDVATLMQNKNAEFCFTSPPYSDMRDYHGHNMSVKHLATFMDATSVHCRFYCVNLGLQRKDGEIYPYWEEYIKAAKRCGLPLTSWNIWSKRNMGGSIANMSAIFPIEHEWLFVFGGSKQEVKRTKKNKTAGLHTGISNRQKDGTTKRTKPKIVKQYGRIGTVTELVYGRHKDHPAAYPVALPAEYFNACTKIGDIVLDPFLGSGTTMIAAEQLERKCFGIEISPIYCDVIIERWENLTGKKAKKLNA